MEDKWLLTDVNCTLTGLPVYLCVQTCGHACC